MLQSVSRTIEMFTPHRLRRTAMLVLALACICGCGQKGDLYFPDEEAALHTPRFG